MFVTDEAPKHSVSITPSPVTSMRCSEHGGNIEIEFPINNSIHSTLNSLQEPWNSVRILGVGRFKVVCRLDQNEVLLEQDHNRLPDVESSFLIGWGISDKIPKLQLVFKPSEQSEFTMLETKRVEFADRKSRPLDCGHMLTMRVRHRQSGMKISSEIEAHFT